MSELLTESDILSVSRESKHPPTPCRWIWGRTSHPTVGWINDAASVRMVRIEEKGEEPTELTLNRAWKYIENSCVQEGWAMHGMGSYNELGMATVRKHAVLIQKLLVHNSMCHRRGQFQFIIQADFIK